MWAVAQQTGWGMGPPESTVQMSICSVPDTQMLELQYMTRNAYYQEDICLFIAPGVEMMDELSSNWRY